MTPHPPDERFFRSYLQQHWLAARGGLDLFRRAARSQSDPATRARLAELVDEVAQDRESLRALARRLGVGEARLRQSLVSAGERLGRLKSNGTLVRRSPLSDVVELEAMSTAVELKRLVWLALRSLAPAEPRLDEAELDRLVRRADDQRAQLEDLRLEAVRRLRPQTARTN